MPHYKRMYRRGGGQLAPIQTKTTILGAKMEREKRRLGLKSYDELTAMTEESDPYRLDTPKFNEPAEWLVQQIRQKVKPGATIHLRGLHYLLLDEIKPDGTKYRNTEAEYLWLSKVPAKAARWSGKLPFNLITDKRNAAPMISFAPTPGDMAVAPDPLFLTPEASDLLPEVRVPGAVDAHSQSAQPFRLVLVGEKASLDILEPVAQEYGADLYLPSGNLSDTLIYRMAQDGAADGRKMIVFYFTDCDPSGYHMPDVLDWKLQALRDLEFPGPLTKKPSGATAARAFALSWDVHHVALTPAQVKDEGLPQSMIGAGEAEVLLPGTRLKDGERRRLKWRERMDVEQTEIDSLVALKPDLLLDLAREAIAPYYDSTLADRAQTSYDGWCRANQERLEAETDWNRISRIATIGGAGLTRLERGVNKLKDLIVSEVAGFKVEPALPELPEAEVAPPELPVEGWVGGSDLDFAAHARRLKDRKVYDLDDDE